MIRRLPFPQRLTRTADRRPTRVAYALPTAFTAGNMFLGFVAIMQAFQGAMRARLDRPWRDVQGLRGLINGYIEKVAQVNNLLFGRLQTANRLPQDVSLCRFRCQSLR